MTEQWHKAETAEDVRAFSRKFWEKHRQDIKSGEFWADRIKALRGEPIQRLLAAIENLPLPAAFREAAIAVRSLIRECRQLNQPYGDQLELLYWLGAVSSFSVPYSTRLEEPGYNVMQAVPGQVLKGLPFSYDQLGYEKIELFNKTDINWLVESWGQPKSHSTLHELYQEVWKRYEDIVAAERKEQEKQSAAEWKALLKSGSPRQTRSNRQAHNGEEGGNRHRGNRGFVIVLIAVLAIIAWLISG